MVNGDLFLSSHFFSFSLVRLFILFHPFFSVMKRKTLNAHNSPGGAPPPTSLEPKTKKKKPESIFLGEEVTEDHTRTVMKRKYQPSTSSVQNQGGFLEEKKRQSKPARIVSTKRRE